MVAPRPRPGPTVLSPTLTLDVGFSPTLLVTPVELDADGRAAYSHVAKCGRMYFSIPLNVQAVTIDPQTLELCASNSLQIVGKSYGTCDDCQPCSGGVTELTLRYLGEQDALVELFRKNKPSELYFADIVSPGASFDVSNGGATLASLVDVRVDGALVATIKANCSTPVAPGVEFGPFRILSASSAAGGRICPLDTGDTGCEVGKAARLGLRYTGNDCSASDNDQEASKWFCDGDPSGATAVRVVVYLHAGQVYADQIVSPGDIVVADAAVLGLHNLKANTFVDVFDLDGTLLQQIGFHTSCSQPLAVGDVFGSIEIVEFVPDLQ
ncbi:MAG: hypothetical protein R3F34_19685 [Planctomycetota bacterium]